MEAWLAANYELDSGIWVRLAKKNSGIASVTSDEVNDSALCFGWITSHRKPYDDVHYLQKITPRRGKSNWSRVNVARVQELIAAGRMRPPGLAQITRAKANGMWDAAQRP